VVLRCSRLWCCGLCAIVAAAACTSLEPYLPRHLFRRVAQSLDQRRKEEHRRRRQAKREKARLQKKLAALGLGDRDGKVGKRPARVSYAEHVKNEGLGGGGGAGIGAMADGAALTLSETGRVFRYRHRWPLLMQLVMALRGRGARGGGGGGVGGVGGLLQHLRDGAFVALGATQHTHERSRPPSPHSLASTSAATGTTSTGGGIALAGRRRGGLTDQVATLAVTPAYLPYAAALTPYARWVSIPALVKVRLVCSRPLLSPYLGPI